MSEEKRMVKYLQASKGGADITSVEKVAPVMITTDEALSDVNTALMHYSYLHIAEVHEDEAKKYEKAAMSETDAQTVRAYTYYSTAHRNDAATYRELDRNLKYTPEDVARWNADKVLKVMIVTFKLQKAEMVSGFESLFGSLQKCINADTNEKSTAKERSALASDCVEKMKALFDGMCGEGVVKVTYKAFKNLKATTWNGIKTSKALYTYNDIRKTAALKWIYDYAFMAIQPGSDR